MDKELLAKIHDAIETGIFSDGELAALSKLEKNAFKELVTPEIRADIERRITYHKAILLKQMASIASGASVDELQFEAIKFLLASLHNVSEKSIIEKAKLELEKMKQTFARRIKAAEMSTKWEKDLTNVFYENYKKAEEVIE